MISVTSANAVAQTGTKDPVVSSEKGFSSGGSREKLAVGIGALSRSAAGTELSTSTDWAWKPIVTQNGVQVHYLFYSETGPKNEGIVIKLVNTRKKAIRYSFTVLFKADGKVKEERVSGSVPARSFKTGESEGLYWTPFERGVSIGEIGIRGLKINEP